MPRGGGRGDRGKRSHKGQRRHFTDEENLKQEAIKQDRQRQWRKQKGIESDEDEEVREEDGAGAGGEDRQAIKLARNKVGDESDSEDDDSEEEAKPKGVEGLIEIENPNRVKKSAKKVTELSNDSVKVSLSRREREELEKQEARKRYQQLHMQGRTEEAQADLARLALIRKQRDEAAKKKDDERKAKELSKSAAAAKKGKS